MTQQPLIELSNLGLWGDGDEIAAIEDVEDAFGIQLDYANASTWLTVGDVFEALLVAIPVEQQNRDDVWLRFAEAISQETGVNAQDVAASTLLLLPKKQRWATQLSWVAIALVGVCLVNFAWNALT